MLRLPGGRKVQKANDYTIRPYFGWPANSEREPGSSHRAGLQTLYKTNKIRQSVSESATSSGKIEEYGGGDTVSTEAVAARRHAGTHLPATWWKLELPTTTWHLLLN